MYFYFQFYSHKCLKITVKPAAFDTNDKLSFCFSMNDMFLQINWLWGLWINLLWGYWRADIDGSSSHFLHPASKAPPNGSPANQHSQSFESDGRGPAPQPLPRRSLVGPSKKQTQNTFDPKRLVPVSRSIFRFTLFCVHQPRGTTSRRVQALYDCQADHHDELSFSEGQVLVVLGQEDSDWWVRIIILHSDWWHPPTGGAILPLSRPLRYWVCTICSCSPDWQIASTHDFCNDKNRSKEEVTAQKKNWDEYYKTRQGVKTTQ